MSYQSVSGVSGQTFSGYGLYQSGGVGRQRDHDDGRGSRAGGIQGAGGSLFSALLQALTQAAGLQAPANTGGSGTGGTSGTGSSTGTGTAPGGNVAQDLHSFLHDLFGALRQASQLAGAGSTSGTGGSSDTTGSSGSAGTGNAGVQGAAQYGVQGIISAVQALLTELAAVQALNTGQGTSAPIPGSAVLTNLNNAFNKLVSDLQSGASASGTGSSASTGASTSATTTSGTSGGTTALQAFLTNLLSDLQAGNTTSSSTLGSNVNTSA